MIYYIPKHKLSGLLDTIFDKVDKYLPLAVGLAQGGSGKTQSTQAKGLAAIQQAGQQVIATLQQIAANPLQFGSVANAVIEAEKIAAYLDNSAYFYQAKNGKDADALKEFKSQARDIIAQMTQATQPTATTQPQAANVISNLTASLASGTDNTTLYYGIGAAVVLAFVLSRK